MIFFGLFFLLIACILLFLRLKYKWKGEIVAGTIVGYVRSAKGMYGFVGYNYRIRLEYNGELYYVTSMESVTATDEAIPRKNLGLQCLVYFNPKTPTKKVTLKEVHQLEWLAFILFIVGVISIMLGWLFI